jgi:hypothetical protein
MEHLAVKEESCEELEIILRIARLALTKKHHEIATGFEKSDSDGKELGQRQEHEDASEHLTS